MLFRSRSDGTDGSISLDYLDHSGLWLHQHPNDGYGDEFGGLFSGHDYFSPMVREAVSDFREKNIVISGGYGLNVIANTYYQEKFPDLNIYVDPICHDGGLSIGAARYISQQYAKEEDIKYEN